MKVLLCGLGLFLPTLLFAQTQSASIITRTGNLTPPLKYHFDLSSSLTEGVNQGVRVAVSASNPEKTAIRFDSVRLFSKDGSPLGNNVASKTDALTASPYSFIFQNFGIAPKDLVNVAGVQITFMDMGGENPTGKILVHGITVSVIRDTGESCIEIDPITITTPEKPRVTINQIQAARPLVQPGTHGDGGGGSSGGGGGTSSGPNYPSSATSGGSPIWGSTSNIYSDNDLVTSTIMPPNTMFGGNLTVTGFNFSIPTGATVNGIEVNIERKYSGASTGVPITDYNMYLWKNGSLGVSNMSSASGWPTSFEVKTFGSSESTWGEPSLQPDMVNSAGFGFVHAVSNNHASLALTASIDYATMTVYYTTGGGSVYDSFMDLLRAISKKIIDAGMRPAR